MRNKIKILSIMMVLLLIGTFIPAGDIFAAINNPINKVVIHDDFEQTDKIDPDSWMIHSGDFIIRDKEGNKQVYNAGETESFISRVELDKTDYIVEIFVSNEDGFPGLLGRFQDTKNFYMFRLEKGANKLELAKSINGVYTNLAANASYNLENKKDYTLKMEFRGNNIKCYINEELIYDVTDDTFSEGSVGVRNKWGKMYIDDICVIVDDEELTGNVEAIGRENTVDLSWDSVSGAKSYDIFKFSSQAGRFQYINTTMNTTYSDEGLEEDTDYLYKIIARGLEDEKIFNVIKVKTIKSKITKEMMRGLINQVNQIDLRQYTEESVEQLENKLIEAENFLSQEDYDYENFEKVYLELQSSVEKLVGIKSIIEPGTHWTDTKGETIQAHGGAILYDEINEIYYWYGEDKTHGYRPLRGVRCYSSKDLYNWKDEGLALQAIASVEELDTDPVLKEVYQDRTDKEKEEIFRDLDLNTAVLERPKVIYNEKTDKWVMWIHADGPTETSTANYAKANAGVAISDSPTGPFEYIRSYRMDYVEGSYPSLGMARDMNLFVDDDGTGYIMYSSEENMTLYISKLTDDYLDITGWNKEGKIDEKGRPIRDENYQAVQGRDFVRIFPKAQREAPAMFKYNEKYYLITSGCTGWDPNPAKYAIADDIFGTWTDMGDPCVGDAQRNTFRSQSTSVISVDPENGKFIFMADRWVPSDLKNSRYIWLPVEFTSENKIAIKWYDKWDLSLLDTMQPVDILTPMPEMTRYGITPELPSIMKVREHGIEKDMPVEWLIDEQTFKTVGLISIEGRLGSGKLIPINIYVIPEDVLYFINCGESTSMDYDIMKRYMKDSIINQEVNDQKFDGIWGYEGTTGVRGSSSNIYESLRYVSGAYEGIRKLDYKFKGLEEGEYTVYLGFYDPWYSSSEGKRKANIYIKDELVEEKLVIDANYQTCTYSAIQVTDNLSISVQPSGTGGHTDVQLSWLMLAKNTEKDNGPQITLSGREEVKSGEEFSLVMEVEQGIDSLYALDTTLQFDTNLFEFIGTQEIESTILVGEKSISEDSWRILLSRDKGVAERRQMISYHFKAKEIEKTEKGDITLKDTHFAHVVDGEATVEKGIDTKKQLVVIKDQSEVIILEDVNGDGKVDVADLAFISYYYTITSEDSDWDKAKKGDLNKDGKINLEDLVKVANKILE